MRSDQDIRITNISISSTTNGAYETYNNKYNKDATFMYVTLPSNSSITYNVEISDKSNIGFDISQITQESHTNSNVHVDISLNVGDMISANSIKIFTITITNNSSTEQIETLVYKYEFVEYINSYVVETYNSPNSYIFNVPYTGIYKIELWGAQGGGSYYNYGTYLSPGYEKVGDYIEGGNGSYTSGLISLNENSSLIIYVGGLGNDYSSVNYGSRPSGGYNGGGRGGYAYQIAAGGGGATDVRLTTGSWNNFESLKSRIMVAGAGGGTSNYRYSVSGGGGGVTNASVSSGAGGSSFISGYSGCDAVSSSSTENNIIYTGQPNHYSGKVFTNGVMIDGLGCDWSTGEAANCGANQPQPDGTSSEGHTGNGYARITFLG